MALDDIAGAEGDEEADYGEVPYDAIAEVPGPAPSANNNYSAVRSIVPKLTEVAANTDYDSIPSTEAKASIGAGSYHNLEHLGAAGAAQQQQGSVPVGAYHNLYNIDR